METYGKILLVAMPAFLLLVLLEKWYGHAIKKEKLRSMDTISSLASGITNVVKDVLGLSIGIISYEWMVHHMAIIHIKETWILYLVAFIVLDFSGYWVHRIAHTVNFFWNNHIIHHSSEEFDLACALRQSISVFVRLFTFLLVPAAVVGVPSNVIAVVAPLHLFAQFWYHTRYIHKMGILEKIIVTPSHHRVHHAINPAYIDKNYSQIFIFWDKWFGSFQEELPYERPVYGITRPANTWNPIKINFQHIYLLLQDAIRTRSWKDKFRLWFMPTGWRPADVESIYPVHKIDQILQYNKYDTNTTQVFTGWCWIQLLVVLLLVSYLFGNIANINNANPYHIYLYGLFIFCTIYAMTELMDHNPKAWISELIKFGLGAYFLWNQGDWFGGKVAMPTIYYFVIIYLIVSLAMAIYFNKVVFSTVKKIVL